MVHKFYLAQDATGQVYTTRVNWCCVARSKEEISVASQTADMCAHVDPNNDERGKRVRNAPPAAPADSFCTFAAMYNVYNEKHILAYLVYSYLLSNWGASIPRPTRIPDRDTLK